MPSIVRDLGGFREFPWLFSVYLLAQAATVPVYGKLADQFGRKPLMYYGIGMFLLGSVLCGLAWSMPVLIAARGLQGLGAGAVQPIGMTIIGDVYSLRERAKIQGYVASVWGVSSVIGPDVRRASSAEHLLSWRFIFWVNIPLCSAGRLDPAAPVRGRRWSAGTQRSTTRARSCSRCPRAWSSWACSRAAQSWAWSALADTDDLRGRRRCSWSRSCSSNGSSQQPILPLWVFRSGTLRTTSGAVPAGRRADPGPVVLRPHARAGRDRGGRRS